jgi:hypothetical protein
VLTWHVGYQTAGGRYAAVEQGARAPSEWVEQQVNRAPEQGSVLVRGEQWARRVRADKTQNSLVHTRGAVTTIVTGTASFDDLTRLAESLQPPG